MSGSTNTETRYRLTRSNHGAKVLVEFVDDLDGDSYAEGEGETVNFRLDGIDYEVDLSLKNSVVLRDSLQPFIAAARWSAGRSRSPRAVKAPRPASGNRERLARIRQWVQKAGYSVSDRGRINFEVEAAYVAAHPES